MSVLERLAEAAPRDLQILNRLGDLLARHGRPDEAIGHYLRIAGQFTETGHVPKAIAIYKKILRLDQDSTESMVCLGQLYLKQKLPAEARSYLGQAAARYEELDDADGAREVYEQLALAEPDNPLHHARVAEILAAAGGEDAAGDTLLAVAGRLLAGKKRAEAESKYRRAAELLTDRPEPVFGIAKCLQLQQREDEAIAILQESLAGEDADGGLMGELVFQLEAAGRTDEVSAVFERPDGHRISDDTIERVFQLHMDNQEVEATWIRMDAIFESWAGRGEGERLMSLMERLADIEKDSHLPALERLCEMTQEAGDQPRTTQALEWLIRAYESRGMGTEVEAALGKLRAIAPESPLVKRSSVSQAAPAEAPAGGDPTPAAPVAEGELDASPVDLEAEAPAVPLNRGDTEFVVGRLTQAEILEKYSLYDQALAQVREVTEKFPGHVPGQNRLVSLLRHGSNRSELSRALVALALASRAAGEVDAARDAAGEATLVGTVDAEARRKLEQLDLLPPLVPTAAEIPAESPAEIPAGVPIAEPAGVTPEPIQSNAVPDPPTAAAPATGDGDIVIDFDSDESFEIESTSQVPEASGLAAGTLDSPGIGDDFASSIAAALTDELQTPEAEPDPLAAEAGTEQSMEEAFSQFRERVREEVGDSDFRTHYDLAIGYKEMGLVSEAISEFEIACSSEELRCEASVMLAVCHRDLGDTAKAEGWYRKAIEAAAGDPEASNALRYELAELLVQSGDAWGALDVFRDVLAADPGYRDVQARVAELEAR